MQGRKGKGLGDCRQRRRRDTDEEGRGNREEDGFEYANLLKTCKFIEEIG